MCSRCSPNECPDAKCPRQGAGSPYPGFPSTSPSLCPLPWGLVSRMSPGVPCGYACLPRLPDSGGAPPPSLPSALQRAPLPPLCDVLPGGTVSSGWLRPVTNRSPACTPLSYSLIRHLNPQALPQPLPPPPGLGPGPLTPSRSHASCHSCALEPQQFR